MLILILLVVLTLVTLVAAFLGAKFWHWAHVLVVVALFFATVGFSFLAAEALRVRNKHQNRAAKATAQLKPILELTDAITRGTSDRGAINRLIAREAAIDEDADEAKGLVDLRHDLRLASQTAGRVWRNAQPVSAVNPQTGAVQVEIEFPSPLGIEQGAILFAFEQGPADTANPEQGRQYLGELRVEAVAGQQVTLVPVLAWTQRDYELQRLAGSGTGWVLYETMPGDRHDLFAGMSDDQLRQLLPADSVEEYLRDGTPWTVDDGEWTKEGRDELGQIVGVDDWTDTTTFVYRRRLRDYAFLFNDLAKRRIELIARGQALIEDTKKLAATLASAKQLGQYRLAERGQLQSDLDGVKQDRAAIEAHLASLERQIERGEALIAKVEAENFELAAQLAAVVSARAGVVDPRRQVAPSRGGVDIDAL